MLAGINPISYEIVNLVISTLCFFIVAIFTRYLAAESAAGRFVLWRWRPFDGMMRHQMAVAIIVTMTGEGLLRSWTWGIRIADRHGADVSMLRNLPYALVPISAATVQALGLLCLVRVFTPDEWHRRAWLACLVFDALLIVGTLLI